MWPSWEFAELLTCSQACYLMPVWVRDSPHLILYQTPRKWKVHDPEMGICEMTQKKIKKVIHVQRETTIRRENFRNCWPSRRIGSVTTQEWSTNEQMTGLVWVLKTVLPERDFEETAPALGRRLGIGLHPVIHSANFPSRTEWLGTIDLLYTVIRLCHCTALV